MLHLLLAYKEVIADLESQADFFEVEPLSNTLDVLKQRVWEIENVFSDELAKDYEKLELSKSRHPSNQR